VKIWKKNINPNLATVQTILPLGMKKVLSPFLYLMNTDLQLKIFGK
jgi:hypothetical protein